ncbi:hypothetical protein GTA08_BOTSDO03322 [Botryosphaeria dothidea]|uniref:Ankyrin repeat protein n=1 Tax=Botryosphaeria dothidea TaxID=55169 RepID=A0A8H4J0H1_9PEZI|nr:hypothetical protein GTA08_BOTSDO03322 [Botryosphaeria dothidea]
MDPVTITGLVASVSQLFEYAGKMIKYLNNVKDAQAERDQLTRECVNLLGQLNDLKSRAETTDSNDPWFKGVRNLVGEDGSLEQFKESLEKIAKTLKPARDVREMALDLLESKHPFANAYQADYWKRRRRFSSQVPIAAVPLQFAIARGLTWIAQKLIKDSPDINVIDPHGRSALQIAVRYNNDPIIRHLLSSGALVLRTNISGQILLYGAIIWESMTIAHLLIESAKSSGLKGDLWHDTLAVALRDENFGAIELLRDLVDADIPVSPLLDEFLVHFSGILEWD